MIDDKDENRLPPEGFRQRGPAPRGTRLLLIRHGECVANAEGLAGGPIGDGGLTALGRRQAMALARRLEITKELSRREGLLHLDAAARHRNGRVRLPGHQP